MTTRNELIQKTVVHRGTTRSRNHILVFQTEPLEVIAERRVFNGFLNSSSILERQPFGG